MKPLVILLVLPAIVLALAGCGSMPAGSVRIGNISNLPQTMLNGAKLDHARSVAMGAARSKGWTIKAADPNRLLLERHLSAASPQASALASNVTPPKIEVETDLVQRPDGTIVALKAFVVTNPGTPDENRLDYTSQYENQLLISLSSLQSAWIETRDKVASTVPVPTVEDLAEQNESRDGFEPSAPVAEPVTASTAERPTPTAEPATAQRTGPPPAPAPASAPAPRPAAELALASSPSPPPPQPTAPAVRISEPPAPAVNEAAASTRTMPAASPAGLPETATPALAAWATPEVSETAPRNDMLVLNTNTRKGLWAYYAEDLARLRGCTIGDRGAVLMQETQAFELHEVECTGAANMLIKCQGGVCEGVQ